MGKAIYAVYLVGAIGIAAIAVHLLDANQAVTSKVMECSRLRGAEQNECMKKAEEMAKVNAAVAKALVDESSEGDVK